MNTQKLWLAALVSLGIASCLISTQANAGLIVNGDFETGDFTGWSATGRADVLSDAQYRSIGATGFFPVGIFTVSFNAGDLPASGVVTQDFATTAGQTYTLDFDFGKLQTDPDGDSTVQSLRVSLMNIADSASLFATIVSDASGTRDLGSIFDHYAFSFAATGATTRLAFADVTAGAAIATDGFLDNVKVTPLSSVPEPSGLALVGTAALMSLTVPAFVRGRRKSTLRTSPRLND
jgi:hypothetical protein